MTSEQVKRRRIDVSEKFAPTRPNLAFTCAIKFHFAWPVARRYWLLCWISTHMTSGKPENQALIALRWIADWEWKWNVRMWQSGEEREEKMRRIRMGGWRWGCGCGCGRRVEFCFEWCFVHLTCSYKKHLESDRPFSGLGFKKEKREYFTLLCWH